jgi:hypothetical protein
VAGTVCTNLLNVAMIPIAETIALAYSTATTGIAAKGTSFYSVAGLLFSLRFTTFFELS